MTCGSSDDFLLELTVTAPASIVTWNIDDFRRAKSLGIQAITPRASEAKFRAALSKVPEVTHDSFDQ